MKILVLSVGLFIAYSSYFISSRIRYKTPKTEYGVEEVNFSDEELVRFNKPLKSDLTYYHKIQYKETKWTEGFEIKSKKDTISNAVWQKNCNCN